MSRSDISTTCAPAAAVAGAPTRGGVGDDAADSAPGSASVWVIQSYRAGENTQLLGLAERLGRPYRVVRVDYRSRAGLLGLLRRTSLAGIEPASRAQFAAPWPRLVITAGLRNEPLCAWIRRASGGRTRIVFVGRTWQRHDRFDLLVTTPQYRLQPSSAVLVNLLTQHRVTAERLRDAAQRHAGLFESRSRPLIAVLLGGSSGPYVLGRRSAALLQEQLAALLKVTGGSLAVTSSSRTPQAFVDALLSWLDPSTFTYRWQPDDPANPYYAMLALADALVVTGDSVAMLSEAAATGKPVLVFDIPTDAFGDATLSARFYRWMMRWLPDRLTRDVGLFHQRFVAAGHGRMLGDPAAAAAWLNAGQRSVESTGDPTRARIEALLSVQAASSGGASEMRPRSTR